MDMDVVYHEGQNMKEFLSENKDRFEQQLLEEAVNVREKIEEIQRIGNIDLINNAHKLVFYIVDQREADLIEFSEQEGVAWAKYSLTLTFKLEWVQAIRRTLWRFLEQYETLKQEEGENFFALEKRINDFVDKFLNSFFLSYSKYKDKLLESQRELVEHLSVPFIPVSSSMCVLPLIGFMDKARMNTIEEKVLVQIGDQGIQTLIMDLSGIAEIEEDVAEHLMRVIDGIYIMGSTPIITGIRPEVAGKLIEMGLSVQTKAETKGSLQQALSDYFIVPHSS